MTKIMNKMNIGALIRERRKELNMTLDEVATRSGMQASNLSDIEAGNRDIRTNTLERISKALQCHPAYLYEQRYETEIEITAGLRKLLADGKTMKLMSISERETNWMRSIRFRPNQTPTKQDYIDLLFIYRNID